MRALLLADTHLLGPFKGHWFDKLRREWQMRRTFQTAVSLHQPEVVFILGDVFDEGQWVDDENFDQYLLRYYQLFHTPSHIKVYSAVGNHDIGFHYRYFDLCTAHFLSISEKQLFSFGRLHPHVLDRFRNAFNESSNTLVTIKSTHFVLLNSMTLSRDGCYFCVMAERDIRRISRRLDCAKRETSSDSCKNLVDKLGFYSRPVLLQHFPTYRKSDEQCEEFDAPEVENYRENWEVLSKNATEFLGTSLNPRVAFSGHSHHYCRTYNSWSVEEYTIASFSWRNKVNPSFLLVSFFHNILKQ